MDSTDHCNFFVQRKKRFCKMTIKSGEKYCGEHQPLKNSTTDQSELDKDRIPCPLDPKHTCFTNKLAAHLKVCNARPKDLPSYIVKNCNIEKIENVNSSNKRPLSSISKEDLLQTICLVEKIYTDLIDGKISKFTEESVNETVKDEIEREDRAHSTKRHLLQTSALLNIVKDEKLDGNGTCFVELGAGKGHLSYYLANMFSTQSECSVLLIDKASHRHKQDNKLNKDCLVVDRIRADISDLMISEVPLVQKASGVVGVSKHLCGAATDLALKCLTNVNILKKTHGMIMATCCHHRCTWDSYVGKSFLKDSNIDNEKFNIICGLVSWATCGSGLSREKRAQLTNNIELNEEDHKKRKLEDQSSSENKSHIKISASVNLGLSLVRREEIGFKAKHVLDWGRLTFLKSVGFYGKLCYYVSKELSPENLCIIVKNKLLEE